MTYNDVMLNTSAGVATPPCLQHHPEPPQDPRIIRTRSQLQKALHTLLLEKGMHAITVSEITECAGVNRATFYAHFVDKNALFEACIRESVSKALDRSLPPGAPFTEANLKLLVTAVMELVAKHTRTLGPADQMYQSVIENAIQEELGRFVNRWFEKKWIERPGQKVSRTVAAVTITSVLFGAGMFATKHGAKTCPNGVTAEIVELLAHGVGDAMV